MNENAAAGVLNGLGEESLYLTWLALCTHHSSLFPIHRLHLYFGTNCTFLLVTRNKAWAGTTVVCLRKEGGAAPLLPLSWADTLSVPMPHFPCWPKKATGSYLCHWVLGNFWSILKVIAKLQTSKTETLRIKWELLTYRWNIWRGSTCFFSGLAWHCLI